MQHTEFAEKFHLLTNKEFDYLHLNAVVADKERRAAEVIFVVPQDKYKFCCEERRGPIEAACREIVPPIFTVSVRFKKSYADEDVVFNLVRKFLLERHRALIGQIDVDTVRVKIGAGTAEVEIPGVGYVCEFCVKTGVDAAIKNYLEREICADFAVRFLPSREIDTSSIIEREYEVLYADTGVIETSNVRLLIGNSAVGRAKYISKYDKPADNLCVCGIVDEFTVNVSKRTGRKYYTFFLDDTTGRMSCAYFSRGKKKGALDCVQNGECLIVSGRYVEDTFRKGNKLIVERAGYCDADFADIQQRRKLTAAAKKKKNLPAPQPFVDNTVSNILDLLEPNAPLLERESFVVFDLETTGLNTSVCKIVEIGAVKVVNGEIVAAFETLVDPGEHIPDDASRVNNIYDNMVEDAPYIVDCLPIFLKFAGDSYLVAHNAAYDNSVLTRVCMEQGVEFRNRVLDTLELARRAYPEFGNYNLAALCRRLQIENVSAHRALSDTVATAKLFVKIVNKLRLTQI